MILTVFERAVLSNVLPKEGNITNLKILRALKESLSLSEEENRIYEPKKREKVAMVQPSPFS